MTIAKACSRSAFETQVSNYDRINAWLMALIIVVGALFLVFATLLFREILPSRGVPPYPVPPKPLVPGEIDPDNLVDPGQELPELQSNIIDLTQFRTDVISAAMAQAAAHSIGSGSVPGNGDGRGGGPPSVIDPGPSHVSQRWKIAYELSDIETYATQLRSFDIDLGIVSQNTNDIWKIGDLRRQNQVVRSSRKSENNTLYFLSSSQRMKRWDLTLAKEAGLESDGCDLDHIISVHFYPESTIELLKSLELESVPRDKTVDQVKETHFRMVNTDNGFEFEVTQVKFD